MRSTLLLNVIINLHDYYFKNNNRSDLFNASHIPGIILTDAMGDILKIMDALISFVFLPWPFQIHSRDDNLFSRKKTTRKRDFNLKKCNAIDRKIMVLKALNILKKESLSFSILHFSNSTAKIISLVLKFYQKEREYNGDREKRAKGFYTCTRFVKVVPRTERSSCCFILKKSVERFTSWVSQCKKQSHQSWVTWQEILRLVFLIQYWFTWVV